jgi:hypothetical protein
MNLVFGEPALTRAVAEHHVLQLALAALVAHRAVERMIGKQELERRFARRRHSRGLGAHDHAFGHRQRAGRHQLRHLLHFDQAHAAGGLKCKTFVVAERRDLNAVLLGGIDDQSIRRGLDGLAVDCKIHQVSHVMP